MSKQPDDDLPDPVDPPRCDDTWGFWLIGQGWWYRLLGLFAIVLVIMFVFTRDG